MRTALFLLLSLSACSRDTEKHGVAEAGSMIAVVPPPARASFAHFETGQLVACLDVETDGPSESIEKQFSEFQKIGGPCAKAFADRITLALCTVDERTDAGSSLKRTAAFYDFADIGMTDERMSECLATGGEWNPLSRQSPLFQRAKLEYDQRQLREIGNRLGKPRP